MSASPTDPSRWLSDLMSSSRDVLWPAPAETATPLGSAIAPWTKAVADVAGRQMEVMNALMAPWSAVTGAAPGRADIRDRRFAGAGWSDDPRFAALVRTYLLQSDSVRRTLDEAPLDERTKAQWSFALRQVLDALSPANMLATNPEALRLAMDTGGASLVEGFRLFSHDLAEGRISMTDASAFEVGRNVGVTPGSVVHRTDVAEVIQYSPTTPEVHELPLVIVPPCINKYYILDLQPANSLVAYAVAQGFTVFLVSWRNAGPELATATWDDYLERGVLAALDVARAISGADEVATLGFCIGGTLLASALAVCAARGEHPASCMTLLTTMLDFADTGEIGLLVSEEAVAAREAAIGRSGLLKGSELAQVFASLRANDLIWPYVVEGYLKGRPPPAFDLLYWNSDDTNLPGPMFCWYVRNTYLENRLREPGGTTQCGERVDLGSVRIPTFVYASKDDHIVPWRTAYASTRLTGDDVTFVLGASGHVAGVINPPAKNKRNYWTGAGGVDADAWFDGAESVAGSWWPAWSDWLAARTGPLVAAPAAPGDGEHPPLEPAPGSYVRQPAP